MQSHICRVHTCVAVTCHLYFWQNNRYLLRATSVTRGRNWYRNKSQHRKLTLQKKILPSLLSRFEPATFWSRVLRSNHLNIPAPQGVVACVRACATVCVCVCIDSKEQESLFVFRLYPLSQRTWTHRIFKVHNTFLNMLLVTTYLLISHTRTHTHTHTHTHTQQLHIQLCAATIPTQSVICLIFPALIRNNAIRCKRHWLVVSITEW